MAGPMRLTIGAPFFGNPPGQWLDDFIEDSAIVSTKVAPPNYDGERNWHKGRSEKTPAGAWARHLSHSIAILRQKSDIIVTCFPQLSITTAALLRLQRRRTPLIAHNFNLGGYPAGPKRRFARWAARAISLVVVHSPSEVSRYASYLGLPENRVRFIPLQRGRDIPARREDTEAPFILAMGSARRDYASLIEAVTGTEIPTVIVARATLTIDLPRPENVKFLSDLTIDECLDLLSQARLSVTPIDNQQTASGQVTFIDAMKAGVPVIATDCPGTEGYIDHGRTGYLVPHRDVAALRRTIEALWSDPAERERISQAAQQEAENRFSDQAAAHNLRTAIEDVLQARR